MIVCWSATVVSRGTRRWRDEEDILNGNTNKQRVMLGAAIAVIVLGLLLAHANYYMPFLSDDALISLRYADRLIEGKGLTWTEGRPVEGYSNLLWILLAALPGSLGMDLILAVRLLGLLCMSAVVVSGAVVYCAPDRGHASLTGYAAGMLFFVGTAPIAVWAIGGLEQPLVAAALAGVIPLYWAAAAEDFGKRSVLLALSLLLGILCLTRPDGPLFTVAIMVSPLFCGMPPRRRRFRSFAVNVASLPVVFIVGQLVFRLVYYGEWVPNTALVKLNPSPHHLLHGAYYIVRGVLSLFPASFIALAFMCVGLFRPESRKRFVPLTVVLLLWLGYVMIVGGDVFPAHRHLVPVVVILAYALAEGAVVEWGRLSGGRKRAILAAILICSALVTGLLQFVNPWNRKALTEHWEWEGRALALTLKDAFFEQRPLLAVTAAGCLPYWTEFPCIDMLGLNDHYLPRNKAEDIGSGSLGHELGDGDYVLRRAPDIIVFDVGGEPSFRSGAELDANEQFHRQYARMPVRTAYSPEYTALVWFRIRSDKIGWAYGESGLTIPAYLMSAFDSTSAFLDRGRLVVGVAADRPAGILLEHIPDDSEVTVVSPDADRIECAIERTGGGARIVLTTDSEALIPVEGIVVTKIKVSRDLHTRERM